MGEHILAILIKSLYYITDERTVCLTVLSQVMIVVVLVGVLGLLRKVGHL